MNQQSNQYEKQVDWLKIIELGLIEYMKLNNTIESMIMNHSGNQRTSELTLWKSNGKLQDQQRIGLLAFLLTSSNKISLLRSLIYFN